MKQDIIKQIAAQANRSESDFTLDATLEDDLMLDSLDLAELQMAFEDEFEIHLDDDAYTRVRTVQDVIDLVGQAIATH